MKTSQFGTFLVIIFSPLIVFLLLMLHNVGVSDTLPIIILGTTVLCLIVGLLFFYKLTIIINNEYVSFKFGFGWYGKNYKISEIKSCKPVRNSFLYGIGIRKIYNGWLYNVSGLSAIELAFKNKKGVVRIGTNKPNDIAQYINKMIGQSDNVENLYIEKHPKYIFTIILISIFMCVLLYFTVATNINGQKEPQISIQENRITISGTYGQEIKIENIYQVDTVTHIPAIEFKSNGFDAGKTRKGIFRLKDTGEVTLYIKLGFSPFILIKTFDKGVIYINFEDRQKTVELYSKIREIVN
jgi:hypothetical protein